MNERKEVRPTAYMSNRQKQTDKKKKSQMTTILTLIFSRNSSLQISLPK